MSKLRAKMAEWLLNLAERVDGNTVKDKMIYPAAQMYFPDSKPLILYDEQRVDKIHAQHIMSDEMMRYTRDIDVDKLIKVRLAEGITDEIMKLKEDEIKKEEIPGAYGIQTVYSLDVYVCRPKKKENF